MPIHVAPGLFESIHEHLIAMHQYPPCTAKICAFLFFDYAREGVTFDEILEQFDVSKSTVSTALNQLLENQHITYFHKEESRKRYFVIDKDFVLRRYKGLLENLINEKDLLGLMKEHMTSLQIENKVLDKRLDIFIATLDVSVSNLENAVKQLEHIG